MGKANSHECAGGEKLIFACSGAADVGEISDRAARKLTEDGKGKMFCLAGLGGRVPAIMDKTRAAARILAIDGCSLDCVRETLKQTGFTRFEHVRVTDLGMEKGQSPATDENVALAAEAAGSVLG
jgi:uncharacterized metal-binding protein